MTPDPKYLTTKKMDGRILRVFFLARMGKRAPVRDGAAFISR